MYESEQEKERQRLKEEYKEHFRKMREAKEQVKSAIGYQKINRALSEMNADQILNTVSDMVDTLKHKVAEAEAKLEIALESYSETADEKKTQAFEEEQKKSKARQTLEQLKMEMGMVYDDLDRQAADLRANPKTMGKSESEENSEHLQADEKSEPETPIIKKTIGKQS